MLQGNQGDIRKSTWHSSYNQIFEIRKKNVFWYGLGECVYQISGLYIFPLCQGGMTQTDISE